VISEGQDFLQHQVDPNSKMVQDTLHFPGGRNEQLQEVIVISGAGLIRTLLA